MTEKEKMLKQLMYDANYDKELLKERNRAKDLCYEYNQLRPSDEQGQKSVMRKLLGKTKENFAVMQPFWCDEALIDATGCYCASDRLVGYYPSWWHRFGCICSHRIIRFWQKSKASIGYHWQCLHRRSHCESHQFL